jgi:hypothetical protein
VTRAGVPLTVPHYYDFGEERDLVGETLVRPGSWDALRTRTDGPFALGSSQADWERRALAPPELGLRAEALARVIEALGVSKVASYGCGIASLEFRLLRIAPHLELTVADYTPETVGRLEEFFPAAAVRQHDLLNEPPLPAQLHLFHRIDTEFTNDQWQGVLRRFASQPVLLIASEVLQARGIALELLKRFGPGEATPAGLVRNRPAFRRLWRDTHDSRHLQVADLEAWILTPR